MANQFEPWLDGGVALDPDPVIEVYKRDVDRTLLRQNLKRSVPERLANLIALQRLAEEARRPKDVEATAELEALLEEREKQ